MPIVGHADLAGKIANALAWIRGVMRIDDLHPLALSRAGEAGHGTSTPARYTGTQVIAALDCRSITGKASRLPGNPANWAPAV